MSDTTKVVDKTMPDGKWEFDAKVTEAFDDMLDRSIPQHDVMRDAVFTVGKRFVKKGTDVVDLGCARGAALDPFIREFGAHNRFIGLEVSDPMIAAARERFKGYINVGVVDIRKADLRTYYPSVKASLTLAVLTIQFTPIEHRQRIFQSIHDNTVSGGALILVEKVLGATAGVDRLIVDRYYELKAQNGYSQDAIDRKRLALEGVLVPVTAAWNEELVRQAGFREIDCIWRWMNFAAWVAIKG